MEPKETYEDVVVLVDTDATDIQNEINSYTKQGYTLFNFQMSVVIDTDNERRYSYCAILKQRLPV